MRHVNGLGTQNFNRRHGKMVPGSARSAYELPMAQRRGPSTLSQGLAETPTRKQALWHVHVQGGLKMTAMAH